MEGGGGVAASKGREDIMAIQRWDPLRELAQMRERMNRMFEDVLDRSADSRGADKVSYTGWKPPVDVIERDDCYVLRADVPGVADAQMQLEVEDDALVLRGERKADDSVPRDAYLRSERPSGHFAIRLSVPPSVDRQAIHATHADGVLEVQLPKRRAELPTKIHVPID